MENTRVRYTQLSLYNLARKPLDKALRLALGVLLRPLATEPTRTRGGTDHKVSNL